MSDAKTVNAVNEADRRPEPDVAPKTARTWIVTLGISFAMLAIMYGLAFWHEARADAARGTTPAPISTPAR